MRLRLDAVRLQLHEFALEADGEFTAESLALFGPSGAGKTTLLEIIAGLRRPDQGSVSLNGRSLNGLPPRDRGIGYVTQDETLFPHMSVRHNIAYGMRKGNAHDIGALAELLEIEPLLDRGVQKLSGGERRRVAIARAVMTSPAVLLLDEPLAGLDAALKTKTMALLQRLREELSLPMIFVSHEKSETVTLCDRVLVLERGRVVAEGRPEAVL